MARSFNSRTAWSQSVSASMDRAAAADQLERQIDEAGWDVTVLVGDEITVVLERPSGIPGLVEEIRFRAGDRFTAMREAHFWVLNEAVSE